MYSDFRRLEQKPLLHYVSYCILISSCLYHLQTYTKFPETATHFTKSFLLLLLDAVSDALRLPSLGPFAYDAQMLHVGVFILCLIHV